MNGRTWLAHRAQWVLYVGPIPEGLWVLHTCDNPPCVNLDHLYLGTPRDNSEDRDERGHWIQPDVSKLTQTEADEIRRRYSQLPYPSQRQLAKEYAVCQHTICQLLAGKTYRNDGKGKKIE